MRSRWRSKSFLVHICSSVRTVHGAVMQTRRQDEQSENRRSNTGWHCLSGEKRKGHKLNWQNKATDLSNLKHLGPANLPTNLQHQFGSTCNCVQGLTKTKIKLIHPETHA